MSKIILTLLFFRCLFENISLSGQNLLPNPDFEIRTACPHYTSGLYQLDETHIKDWYIPTDGTSDYYHPCGDSIFETEVSVPTNLCSAYQPAHSGIAYLGSFISHNNTNYREYIQAQLNDSLIAGEYYYFEGWLAPATRIIEGDIVKLLTSDAIGLYFSEPRITDFFEYDTLGVDAHVSNVLGNFVITPGGWTKMSCYYLAEGGEAWFTMGNFKDELHTAKIPIPGYTYPEIAEENIYFFIDDLSLTLCNGKFLPDTMLCEDDILFWDINLGPGDYLWSNGDTTRFTTISTPGIYWLQYTDSIVTLIDSSTVTYHIDTTFTSVLDRTICPNEIPYNLYSSEIYDDYLWSTGSDLNSTYIYEEDTYILTAHIVCNTYIDSFNIYVVPPLDDSLLHFTIPDTVVCANNWSLNVEGPNGFTKYLWSNGDTMQSTTITEPGTYNLHYALPCYDFFEYFTVKEDIYFNAQLNLGNDIDLCDFNSPEIILDAGELPNYLWNTGETTQTIIVNSVGEYSVTSTTGCKILSDSILISDCSLLSDDIYIFPVPSFGKVTIKSRDELFLENATLEIMSLQGLLLQSTFDFENEVSFDFTNFMKGYYLVKLYSKEKVYFFNMILQ